MNLRKIRRITIFYLMLISGVITMFTGIVLYLWPKGPRAGRIEILGYTKDFWKDIHITVAIIAIILIVIHLIENRRAVKCYVEETLKV